MRRTGKMNLALRMGNLSGERLGGKLSQIYASFKYITRYAGRSDSRSFCRLAAHGKAEGVPVLFGFARTPRILGWFVRVHKIFEKTLRYCRGKGPALSNVHVKQGAASPLASQFAHSAKPL